jgi:DNA-binding ferritin-like protein
MVKIQNKSKNKSKNKNTRKNRHSKLIVICLDFLNNLKLFHWNTKSYSQHMASDSLYEELTKSIDTLVESFLQERIPIQSIITLCTNPMVFMKKMKDFKIFINEVELPNELLSLRDDIVVALDQFEYRLTLK